MKKSILAIGLLAVLFAFTACGGREQQQAPAAPPAESAAAAPAMPPPATTTSNSPATGMFSAHRMVSMYLGNGYYQVYVQIDGAEVPYVTVNSRTGWYHG